MGLSTYVITKHAKRRMIERGIMAPTVRAVLLHGRRKPTGDASLAVKALGITVILDGDKIVTIY